MTYGVTFLSQLEKSNVYHLLNSSYLEPTHEMVSQRLVKIYFVTESVEDGYALHDYFQLNLS